MAQISFSELPSGRRHREIKCKRLKVRIALLWEPISEVEVEVEQSLTPHPTQYRSFRRRAYLRATGRRLSCGITQCYMPPDTSERAPP